MTIILRAEVYELLCKHVAPESPDYAPVATASKISGESSPFAQFSVECSNAEALAYWRLAKKNFPGHAKEIETAIAVAVFR